jgi:hypothetical protein
MANQPIHHSPSFWLIMAGLWAWLPIVCIDNLNSLMALLNPKAVPAPRTQAIAIAASAQGSFSPLDLLPPIPAMPPSPHPSAARKAVPLAATSHQRAQNKSGVPHRLRQANTPGLITVGLGKLIQRSRQENPTTLLASRNLPVQRRMALATPIDSPDNATAASQVFAKASNCLRPGAAALGGELSLSSLNETTTRMVPAARIEKLQREASPDPLSALPRHWRQDLQPLLSVREQVMPAEVVRLPANHLRQAQTVPITLNASGQVISSVEGLPQDSLNLIGQWADRQAKVPQGSLRPVMVVLEPASQLVNDQLSP